MLYFTNQMNQNTMPTGTSLSSRSVIWQTSSDQYSRWREKNNLFHTAQTILTFSCIPLSLTTKFKWTRLSTINWALLRPSVVAVLIAARRRSKFDHFVTCGALWILTSLQCLTNIELKYENEGECWRWRRLNCSLKKLYTSFFSKNERCNFPESKH